MKKVVWSILALIIIAIALSLSGYLKQDTYDNIKILTTVYPEEYIVNYLYGNHATVESIYPDGISINGYTLTDEQVNSYSANRLYIFNGLSDEKNYVVPMLKNNKNLKIIDASMTMSYDNDVAELWLNPSNFLMMAQNIRNGLNEYITNYYLKQEINDNYDKLKIEVSTLDANIKLMVDDADTKTIVVDNDAFKFLEKYGLTVISLEENDNLNEKTIAQAEALIKDGTVKTIFTYQYNDESDTVKRVVSDTGVKLTTLETLSTITSDERSAKSDYLSIMNDNLGLIKDVLYN
jgi:zinc transport system substrate-binding protein